MLCNLDSKFACQVHYHYLSDNGLFTPAAFSANQIKRILLIARVLMLNLIVVFKNCKGSLSTSRRTKFYRLSRILIGNKIKVFMNFTTGSGSGFLLNAYNAGQNIQNMLVPSENSNVD